MIREGGRAVVSGRVRKVMAWATARSREVEARMVVIGVDVVEYILECVLKLFFSGGPADGC
jgi:hypothetical protein